MSVGFRVYTELARVPTDIVDSFRDVSVPDVSDAMHGIYAMDGDIRQLYEPMRRIIGPAVTVAVTPGDGLMLRMAVEIAMPGDVLVVNAFGALGRALLGGNVCRAAREKGVAGMVLDGVVRDVREIESLGFAVMARGLSPRSGTTDAGWGEVNTPIACGGVPVHPGDLVIADQEGIAVVPGSDAESVLRAHLAKHPPRGVPEMSTSGDQNEAPQPIHQLNRAVAALDLRGGSIEHRMFGPDGAEGPG